jgi:Topoisomerase 6 subunit A/Spo11, Toprim domain
LKFVRADCSLFRTVEGLEQKAGVPKAKLSRLVMKELVDNALDEGGKVDFGYLAENENSFFVEDTGRGIDGTPEQIGALFSISRPLISTKLLRLPTRGALGNGLRVVAGAVLASDGRLVVKTRDRRLELRPERDGTTTVVRATKVKFPVGTRIEITFGAAIPCDGATLAWAHTASRMAPHGSTYAGRSSPFWYDVPQFSELLYASGDMPVRELVAALDGCTGANAGHIVAAAKLNRAICRNVNRDQATDLLMAARAFARPVNPKRLGAIGPDAFPEYAYAQSCGVVEFGSIPTARAEVPFVVECWARKTTIDTRLLVCVNRTPITGAIEAARDKRDIDAFGCGLAHTIAQAPIGSQFYIVMNLITPYMPITSDGKEPNLEPFLDEINTATAKAIRKAHRPSAGSRTSQKDIVLSHLDEAIEKASGGGKYRFLPRQIFYVVRPIVWGEIGETLERKNFDSIITDYENEHGEIPRMYRKPRGTIYHPHIGETIPIGTLTVEQYERPIWTFNKLMYIEKEGWTETLKETRWPERHDCMVASCEGFTTRAIKDLVDKLAEHDEPVDVFCVHDADGPGTLIYQTFQEATKARGARKIRIINLGLEPWEALAMGLEVESVEATERRKAVADYVRERDDITDWEDWLQTHRVELNAMTTPEFIAWLDRKMAEHGDGKLVPPSDVLVDELEERLEARTRSIITERILREADLEGKIIKALRKIKRPSGTALANGIKRMFERAPEKEWRDHIDAVVAKVAGRSRA